MIRRKMDADRKEKASAIGELFKQHKIVPDMHTLRLSLTVSFVGWLVGWLVGYFVCWLVG